MQPTPNPDAFQFILNGKVIGDGTKTFDSPDDAGTAPLAKALFDIFGIQSIYLKEILLQNLKTYLMRFKKVFM